MVAANTRVVPLAGTIGEAVLRLETRDYQEYR
jgi:hypothetical protein